MNPDEITAARRIRLLFEGLVDLDTGERAKRLERLDPSEPDVAQVVQLLDAHDHASERLDPLAFLRRRHEPSPVASSFDAVAAFAPHYTIEGELAGGGMSRVFVGRDAKLGRKIVAKVLPPELGAEIGLGRFQQEIRLAAQLRHPHIVPLLESGEAAGCLYYTMPFIEGESLRDRLRREGTLPLSIALRIAGEIADALAYAHRLGVIHRDIKPGNVLLDSDHAVVTDFGIARALRDVATTKETRSGVAIGTPAYMSPEQASGVSEVDARTDVYSLGCVLYEMLYGAPPLAGAVAFTPTGRTSQVRVPARVRAIIVRAIAAHPDHRFQSAQEMREALLVVDAPRVAPRTVMFGIIASVALILGAWVALRPPPDQSFASAQAVVRRVTTRGDVTAAAISPGGAYLAVVTSDTSILRLYDIDAGTQTILDIGERNGPPQPWSIRQIGWSRDGNVLYFLPDPFNNVLALSKLGPWRMVIENPLLADPLRSVTGAHAGMTGFAPSPVDSLPAAWTSPGATPDQHRAAIYQLHTGKRFHVDTIDVRIDMGRATISFSPNGRWLAACGGSRDGDAWRVALLASDGRAQTMLDSAQDSRAPCGVIWSFRGDSLYVWPNRAGSGMTSYAIDDATGRARGPSRPFPLRPSAAGERTAFSLSADGKRLAYVERTRYRGVAVADLGAETDVPSHDAAAGVHDPRWPEISPSGDRFAYVVTGDSGSAIYTRDLRGGEPRRLGRDYHEKLTGVRWTDDATRIATLTQRDSQNVFLILDATGSEVMTVRPKHAVYDTSQFRPSFDWAARGTGIMYTSLNAAKRRPDVWLIDLASGSERLLLAAGDGASSQQLSLPVWSPDGKSLLYDSLGTLIVKDAATGARQATLPDRGAINYCSTPPKPPCERHTIVPLRWRADGAFFSERRDRDGSTTIWRSSLSVAPTLYAHVGKECNLISLDRDADRVVCQVYREESDAYVVTRP